MSDRIQQIVRRLPRMVDLTEVWETAERSLAEGDAAFVADLGIALTKAYGAETAQLPQYRGAFDHLLRLLALTPGGQHTRQALRLVAVAARADRKQARYAASLLAAGQTPDDLVTVFAGGGSHAGACEELRACLVHELVLRHVAVCDVPGIAAWARSPHWRHHPLGRLPLSLSALEEAPALPSYSLRGESQSIPYGPDKGPGAPLGRVTRTPPATETTTEAAAAAIAAAVANWVEESNGQAEARTYDLAEPLDGDSVPDTLVSLGLECLQELGPRKRFSLASCSASRVWRILFAAASAGGAYNLGLYGAYGRLAAWRSLAALSGAAEGASPEEVERQARECAWYGFEAATRWFQQVAWDIGLAAVAPGRRRLAVLAATDTD